VPRCSFHLAPGLDVDDGAGGEGKHHVGVERESQPRLFLAAAEKASQREV
jgi:hypothetical protein